MVSKFDLVQYLEVPELDVPEAVALGIALLGAVPASSPPSVREAALALRTAVLCLRQRWAERSAQAETELALSGLDARLGNAWTALYGALKAATRLPSARERSQLASRLLLALFPDALRFLNLPSAEKRYASAALQERIEREGLARPISLAIGHPEFLEELVEAQGAYRLAGNTSECTEDGEDVGLELWRFRESTVQYVLQLAAWCARSSKAGDALLACSLRSLVSRPPRATPATPVPGVA